MSGKTNSELRIRPSRSADLSDALFEWREDLYLSGDVATYWADPENNPDGSRVADSLIVFSKSDDIDGLRALALAVPQFNPDKPDSSGATALGESARIGALEATQALLLLGADPNTPDLHGVCPLGHAGGSAVDHSDQSAIVDLLVRHGADLECRDRDGLTPFLRACRAVNLSAATALARAGSDIFAASDNGADASDWSEAKTDNPYPWLNVAWHDPRAGRQPAFRVLLLALREQRILRESADENRPTASKKRSSI